MMLSNDIPPLRYQRFGGGYRREDVEDALQQLLLTLRGVEADLNELRTRSAELEEELRAAREELQVYREREAELQALIARAEELQASLEGEVETASPPQAEG